MMTTCLCPACQRTMWSSKMAARWRGEDGDLNAGDRDFLASNTLNEVTVCSFKLFRHPIICTRADFDE